VLKSEKEELIKELNEKFAKTKTGIVAEFSKLNVETVTKLRKKLREGKVEYKVLKNTLAKRAAKGTPMEVISGDFTGPVAVVLSYDDVIAPAKILSTFIKDMETIKVRSAVVEGRKVDAAGVKALASMPGLPELRAQILGMLTQPAGKLARTIAAPGFAAGARHPGVRGQEVIVPRSYTPLTSGTFLPDGRGPR
jgi:large subunit ribosomal protein L10